MKKTDKVNLLQKFSLFSDQWKPKIVGDVNDHQIKVVKFRGDFVWHSHAETDEVFVIIEGELRIDFRDGSVNLKAGDLFVVPKGKEHKPFAASECKLMLIEPAGTVNTGDAGGKLTAPNDAWI